jgi:hypothetical protein
MSAWDTRKEELNNEMEASLSDISIDDVKNEGMTIRIGGRVVKLEMTEEVSLPEDDIRAEYSAKLTEKLQRIKDVLNEKMSEMTYMTEQYRQDFEEKERKLKRKLEEANLMPDITYEHAKQGLSVVRTGSREQDALTWLYQGVYWPKFYDGKPIDPKYAKRMISPVTLCIKTVGKRIQSVTVNKTIGLGKFDHYHRHGGDSDCWGSWRGYNSDWSTPDDILRIARKAMAVLENVNPMSPGNPTPAGLPRLETLGNHVLRGAEARAVQHSTNVADERAGITETDRGDSDDVWST